MANAQSMAGYFSLTQIHDAATGTASPYGILTIFSMLAWGLGYFGMPHVLLRFMAIEDVKEAEAFQKSGNCMGCDLHVCCSLHWSCR